MNIMVILFYSAFLCYSLMGINILISIFESKINRLFFIMCICLAFWSFCGVSLFFAYNSDLKYFWLQAALLAIIPFCSLIIHFSIILTKLIKMRIFYIIILYTIPVILNAINLLYEPILYKDFLIKNGQYIFVETSNKLLLLIYSSYAYLCIITGFLIILIWGFKTKSKREKRQSIVISSTLLLGITLGMLDEVYIPRIISNYHSHGVTAILLLIWMIGIWFSINRYRFLSFTPEFISNDVLSNIDEIIILINKDMHIYKINKIAEKELGLNNNELTGLKINDIIFENEIAAGIINDLFNEKIESYNTKINLLKANGEKVIIDARISSIKDKFKDIIGVLIIGKEIKGFTHLKKIYKITDRESEVIQQMINGKTNKEIAEIIKTTERTVKAHITNIYNKLNVDNKIQLMNLLKDFDLIVKNDMELSN